MYQSNDDLTICVKLLYWGFQLVNLINFLGLDIDIIISLFLLLPTLYSILFDDKKLKQSSFSSREGFGIRAIKGERTAYSHSSEINNNKIKNAAESISFRNKEFDLIKKNNTRLNNDVKRVYSNENPFHNIDLSNKLKLLKKIDEYARQTEKNIQQVSVSLNASLQEVFILRAEEEILNDIRPMVRIYVSVIIEENGKIILN